MIRIVFVLALLLCIWGENRSCSHTTPLCLQSDGALPCICYGP